MSRSRSPKARSQRAAAVPPTWRMPSAVRRLARGRSLESSIAATRFVAESSPKPSRPMRSRHLEPVAVGRVGQQAGLDELGDALLAEALDVHGAARGEVDDPLHTLRGAVGVDAVGVALALEALERAPAARAGLREAPRLGSRPAARSSTGPTTSGMTSPALRTTTVSPGRTSFRRTWSSLCRLASPTTEPAMRTGWSFANGVARPGAPDRDEDVLEHGGLLLGRELVGDRPPGRVRGGPEAGVERRGPPPSRRPRRSRSRAPWRRASRSRQ